MKLKELKNLFALDLLLVLYCKGGETVLASPHKIPAYLKEMHVVNIGIHSSRKAIFIILED